MTLSGQGTYAARDDGADGCLGGRTGQREQGLVFDGNQQVRSKPSPSRLLSREK